jgi:anti-sigma-K factor RskA
MIPENPDDLHVLAGEYVLGVLDEAEASEVAGALASNFELRRAVGFWERQLHPLAELTAPAEPPPAIWEGIEARIARPASKPAAPGFWNDIARWRCGSH